jgi:hypothetical protein
MHTTHPALPDADDQREASALTPLRVWFSHPTGCLCDPCAWVDHWIDRDDDRTLEGIR